MAMPMEWLDVAQADTAEKFGPLMPFMMLSWPGSMLMMVLGGLLLDAEDAADAGTDQRADALGIFVGDFQTRIVHRHERRSDAVMDERIHLLHILGGHEGAGIEVADLAGDARGELRDIERGDGAQTGTSVDDAVPAAGHVIAQWRDHAHAGDHYATLAHIQLLGVILAPAPARLPAANARGRKRGPGTTHRNNKLTP